MLYRFFVQCLSGVTPVFVVRSPYRPSSKDRDHLIRWRSENLRRVQPDLRHRQQHNSHLPNHRWPASIQMVRPAYLWKCRVWSHVAWLLLRIDCRVLISCKPLAHFPSRMSSHQRPECRQVWIFYPHRIFLRRKALPDVSFYPYRVAYKARSPDNRQVEPE